MLEMETVLDSKRSRRDDGSFFFAHDDFLTSSSCFPNRKHQPRLPLPCSIRAAGPKRDNPQARLQ